MACLFIIEEVALFPEAVLLFLLGLAMIVIVVLVILLAKARIYMAGMRDALSTLREPRYLQ